MFIAGKDRVFISCDFSKQEPCILASVCKDPKLIEVFHSGKDIYSSIASMVFNVPYEDCLEHYPDGTTNKEGKERRSISKQLVLSVMYSKGVSTLSEDLHCSVEKAQQIVDAILLAYPQMKNWMETNIRETIKRGYCETIFGRRRRWPELSLPKYDILVNTDDKVTEEYYKRHWFIKMNNTRYKNERMELIKQAEKQGITILDNTSTINKALREITNFCIQCGASTITLRAMRNIFYNKRLRELDCRLVMSIHDKLNCRV